MPGAPAAAVNSTLIMIIIYSNDVKVKGPLAEHANSL